MSSTPQTPNDDERLATWLSDARLALRRPRPPGTPDDTADHTWPPGPAGVSPQVVQQLCQRALADPDIMHASPKTKPGLTASRMVKLGVLAPERAAEQAAALLVWFDWAGILAPIAPSMLASRWKLPRPLLDSDERWLARQLRQTPHPSAEAIRAHFPMYY